jgi:hypothetical protein
MKFRLNDFYKLAILALGLWAAPDLRADVTIRYQSEIKTSAVLQPMMEKLGKTMQASTATSIRMRGNKGYTTAGNSTEIFDFATGDVTLLDPAHKTYAVLPMSQLANKIAGAVPQMTPEQTKALQEAAASIKSNVESKMTGKTAEIQGVQAEEREVTLTMDMPMLAAMNPNGPAMRMVMHIWTARKEEALRVPSIRELTGYQAWQRYMLNPAGMFEKLAGKMPGMSDNIRPVIEELFKNPSVILRTHVEMHMPFLVAMLAKQMSGQGQPMPAVDPDAPVLEMNQEVAELSSAPVDGSLFEIPAGYAAVSADDMVREMATPQK